MKITIIAGARPNFMKIAPLMRSITGITAGVSVEHIVDIAHDGVHTCAVKICAKEGQIGRAHV